MIVPDANNKPISLSAISQAQLEKEESWNLSKHFSVLRSSQAYHEGPGFTLAWHQLTGLKASIVEYLGLKKAIARFSESTFFILFSKVKFLFSKNLVFCIP